ncbi:MAG TPA: DUF1800 domain-containing protein [Acidobacteriota bacterium]|nr:DUF1800 domain-containing protein [Acidobacteriota bacterium]
MKRPLLFILILALAGASLAAQGPVTTRPSFPARDPGFTWDRANAAHLMRRAGFSASPQEIDRMVSQGFIATLDELLEYETVDDSAMEEALAARDYQLSRAVPQVEGLVLANPVELNRWWLYRMINSRRQLLEKMTYFWHDHFATSLQEVNQVKPSTGRPLILIQQDTFREHALGNFKDLVHDMARDPAMLIWLDNFLNVRNQPNENWARELLELFTMGVDQYTEEDIQEAARAFTGWTFDFDRMNPDEFDYDFLFIPVLHDFGPKTFLGRTGNWNGDDIINIIFEQDVTAEFIAAKLWEFLVYPDPDPGLIRQLGRVLRENGYELKPLLRAIFRHPEFFSQRAYRGLMKAPVEAGVAFAREMELESPEFLPFFINQMNQLLFLPPDVGGWTSGVGWVNTSTLLFRYDYYNDMLAIRQPVPVRNRETDVVRFVNPADLEGMVQRYGLVSEEDVVDHFVDRLLAGDATADEKLVLEDYLRRQADGTIGEFDIANPVHIDTKVRGLAYLVTLLPAYQTN